MDFYVSSVIGDDENPGTADAPFKTILRLTDRMESGDTGYLDGEFAEQLKLGGTNGIPGGKHALSQTYIKKWPSAVERPLIIGEESCVYAGDPDIRYITIAEIELRPSRLGVGCLFDMPITSGEFTFDDVHIIPTELCLHNVVVERGGKIYFTGLMAVNAELDNIIVFGSENDQCQGIEIDLSEIDGSRTGCNLAIHRVDGNSTAGIVKVSRSTFANAATGNIDIMDRSLIFVELCRLTDGGTHNIRTGMARAVVRYNVMDNAYGGENVHISSDTTTAVYSNVLENAGYGVRLSRNINIEMQGTGKTYMTHNTIVYQSTGGILIEGSDEMFADQQGIVKTRTVLQEELNTEDGDGTIEDIYVSQEYTDLTSLFIENNRFALEGSRPYLSMDGIQPHSLYVWIDGNRYFGSEQYDAWGGLNFDEWRALGRDEHSGEGSDPQFVDPLNDNYTILNIADQAAGITPTPIEDEEILALVQPGVTQPHDNTPGAFAF